MTDTTQAAGLTKDQIRSIFMAHGFTIKDGQTDLKSYVYKAAEALIDAALAAQAVPATRRLTDADRVPDEYRNQARGYRAGWNDAISLSPAPAEAKEEPIAEVVPGTANGPVSPWIKWKDGLRLEVGDKLYTTPQPQAAQPVADIEALMSLVGQYWDIAHAEGETGQSMGDRAQRVLDRIRSAATKLYTAAPALTEEQERDKVRLDFMETEHRFHVTNSDELISKGFITPRWTILVPLSREQGFRKVGQGDTLRAAIDASLRSTQGGE